MILSVVFILVLCCCAASWCYWAFAAYCVRSVLRRPARPDAFLPSVSILKPVKGIDSGAIENFLSFCQQDYPDFELIFGVSDRRDPAVKVIEELKARHPDRSIRLQVAPPLGANPKAAILQHLAEEASGQVLVISDSDIRVTEDYLRRVVVPLQDPAVGLVTCLYRGEFPANFTARLAALQMDTTFAPSAALGWKTGTPVGLGATLAMRARDLAAVGGYAAIADYLLDDYELAARIARLGKKVVLSEYVVASVLGEEDFGMQWRREVRWSRGIRASHPMQYPGLLVTFSLPLGILAAAFSGVWHWAWIALLVSLAVRFAVAAYVSEKLGQTHRRILWLLPLRDLLSAGAWAAAFVGRKIAWRGNHYLLQPDGRMTPLGHPQLPNGFVARGVRRLDAWLRRRQGIFEFTQSPRSMLRLALVQSKQSVTLSDGTRVQPGDVIGELHIWNDRLPLTPVTGPDLAWAMELRRGMSSSMEELAEAARRDPRLKDVKVFGATAVFFSRRGEQQIRRMAGRLGFETIAPNTPPKFWRKFHDFWENFLIFGLQWVYNPGSLRGKAFIRPREPLWISRERLIDRYVDAPARGDRERHGAETMPLRADPGDVLAGAIKS